MSARQKVNIRKFPVWVWVREREKKSEALALAPALTLFLVPGAGLEPAQP